MAPIYTPEDYYQILTGIIREDQVVPFSCYLLLSSNQRVVCLVPKDEPFDSARLAKLRSFSIQQLYILKTEVPAYEEYLRVYLKTEDGAVLLETLKSQGPQGSIVGLPDSIAQEFGVEVLAQSQVVAQAAAQAEAQIQVQLAETAQLELAALTTAPLQEEAQESLSAAERQEVTVVQGSAEEQGKVTVEGGPQEAEGKQVVDGGELPEEEKQRIRAAIEKIAKDIVRVRSNPDPEALKRIKEEVQKVSGIVGNPGRAYRVLQPDVERIQKSVEELEKPGPANRAPELDDSLLRLKQLVSAPAASGEVREKVESQSQVVAELTQRLADAKNKFVILSTRWDEFQAKVQAKTEPEKMAAKEFAVHLRDLQTIYLGVNQESEGLLKSSQDLCKTVGIEARAISTGTSEPAPGSLEPPPESPDGASIEEVRSENSVLRTQLANSRALLDSGSEKIEELRKTVDSQGPYIQNLEKDNEGYRTKIDELQEKTRNLEGTIANMDEAANTAHLAASRSKMESQAQANDLQRKHERIEYLERELAFFKDKYKGIDPGKIQHLIDEDRPPIPLEVVELLKEKDRAIARMTSENQNLEEQLKVISKENSKLKGTLEDTNTLKKRMSLKFERLDAEKESFRAESESANRKLIAASNLLDTERKTISKLTEITEELKRDRVEFMGKTNAAMKGYKEMMSKANLLNNHVQAEIQRNTKIQEQLTAMKERFQNTANQLAESERQRKALEAELRRLRKKSEAA